MKKNWIYQIRGMAIVAVILDHMRGVLYSSENIFHPLSFYAVSIFIFLMGITQVFSIQRARIAQEKNSIIKWLAGRVCSPFFSYAFAVYAYMNQSGIWTGLFSDYLDTVFLFNVSGPFYFMRYYFFLTIISPLLYLIVKGIVQIKNAFVKTICILGVSGCLLVVGDMTFERFKYFGGTYLFVYFAGMLFAFREEKPLPRMWKIGIPVTWICSACIIIRYYQKIKLGDTTLYGVENLLPHAQLNPPNFTLLFYSATSFLLFYILFYEDNRLKVNGGGDIKLLYIVKKVVWTLGKYSLDIFLWHVFILNILQRVWETQDDNLIALKWIIYIGALVGFPIVGRKCYTKIKNKMYNIICAGE